MIFLFISKKAEFLALIQVSSYYFLPNCYAFYKVLFEYEMDTYQRVKNWVMPHRLVKFVFFLKTCELWQTYKCLY